MAMTYKFNRRTYLSPEDLVLAFVENVDTLEMAKLHLKDQFVESWLTEIRDYDTLIFLKKLKENHLEDFELIIFEILFYLNPERSFGFFEYGNLDIIGLEGIINEILLLKLKSQEASFLLWNLFNGRINTLYQVFLKHSKVKDIQTEKLYNYFALRQYFKTIKQTEVLSDLNLKTALNVIDVYKSPKKYCIYKDGFIEVLPLVPTVDEIDILQNFFPTELQSQLNILRTTFSDRESRTVEEMRAEVALHINTFGKFIQNFLIDFISKQILEFKFDNWVNQIKNYLNQNDFAFDKFTLTNSFLKFYLDGKWGIISSHNFKIIVINNYLDIKELREINKAKYFLCKTSDVWEVINYFGKSLGFCQSGEFNLEPVLIKEFESGGKIITGIFNKKNERLYPFDEVFEFNGGYAVTKTEGKYNYITSEGKILLETPVEMATDFHNCFAGVRINKKWGLINSSGKLLPFVHYTSSEKIPVSVDGIVFDQVVKSEEKNGKKMVILGTSQPAQFDDISLDIQIKENELLKNLQNDIRFERHTTIVVNNYAFIIKLNQGSINSKFEDGNTRLINSVKRYSLNKLNREITPVKTALLLKDGHFYWLKKDNKYLFPELYQVTKQ